ncbi:MAG TPA: serine/threonine-protein kinase [Kiritimatiellia bacterium]|nr:serine/threonine-protein kinase [Kiritimatiellia bacterium]HRZ13108.1 serine/threonine-protein kinase [Kiritimatiellia bacterium]HSA17529.1 serine/threonine-protein kinase [Kiritimatiellia bacterium]
MAKEPEKKVLAGRYEIRRPLGAGGVGMVYQAWDLQLHRFVAVKRWRPPDDLVEDSAGTEKLWREAMTLAAIQHPNILTIHDFGVDPEGPYVIMEYVDGETLDRVIQRGPFDRDSFAEASQQILEALIAAHQAGMIHRDLKPQNIMRTRLPSGGWQYKILDFGLARFVTQPTVQSMEGNTSIYGSIFFIAPEQLKHQPLDARTDIYAIGCVCYYMLAGRYPFEGDSIPGVITSHLEHNVKPLGDWRPDLPPSLCNWVMKALSFSPDERWGSAAEALTALRRILPGTVRTTTIKIVTPVRGPQITPLGAESVPPTTGMLKISPVKKPEGAAESPAGPGLLRRALVYMVPLALLAAIVTALVWLRAPPAPPEAIPAEPAADSAASTEITAWPPYIPEERRALVQLYFKQLRDLQGFKWASIGTVMEALAAVQFKEQFDPSQMQALPNISYHDETGRTVGELDVVLWNVPSNCAEVVYEAVITDNLRRNKASSWTQLNRFRVAVQERTVHHFIYAHDPTWKMDISQFDHARYGLMGSRGALAEGYESEVDITRAEAEFLQRRIIEYQKNRHAGP